MSLTRWDPFREMVSLRDAMDRLFEESFFGPLSRPFAGDGHRLSFPVDMYETDDSLVVSAALPGLKSKDVDISISGNMLTIKGEFKAEDEGKRGNVHFQERRYGKVQRSISLPSTVNTDRAEATFEDGILKITLPKIEEAKAKQIPVKSR